MSALSTDKSLITLESTALTAILPLLTSSVPIWFEFIFGRDTTVARGPSIMFPSVFLVVTAIVNYLECLYPHLLAIGPISSAEEIDAISLVLLLDFNTCS